MNGETVSHYRILEQLGVGGMGVVYKAVDTRLNRVVALKFLSSALTRDPDANQRFRREAQAASALDHPSICTIYEIAESDDHRLFIAMAYYEGETLKQKIERGPLPVSQASTVALQIAHGLTRAHAIGLVHRDLKPANVIVTTDGVVKIVDFGLAKVTGATELTRTGTTMGTAAYMSPEQVQGGPVDARTDVWALGVVLYEMLAGSRPFEGENLPAIILAIVNDQPKPLREARPDVPEELVRIVSRALERNCTARYSSASEIVADLEAWLASLTASRSAAFDLQQIWRQTRRPRIAVPTLLILAALIAGAVSWTQHGSHIRWAKQTALPEAYRLADTGKLDAAYALAIQAETYIRNDVQLAALWPRISGQLSLHTDPPGADVLWKPYDSPDVEWRHAGRSPVEAYRLPAELVRFRLQKEGFAQVEGAMWAGGTPRPRFTLDPERSVPLGMVHVITGTLAGTFEAIGSLGPMDLADYWIDKYEVTNREFKEFVDNGGYRERKYWQYPFVTDTQVLSWEQAMAEFRDATGRPGPATWEAGGYPSARADFPVTGISWYEAAAYAVFAGKSLPTVYHWLHAATGALPFGAIPNVIGLSNFRGNGITQTGTLPGLGAYGTYDMAGNAREWVWNEYRGGPHTRRYILGGSWGEPTHRAASGDSLPPFDRSALNGFRCVKYIVADARLEKLTAPIEHQFRNYDKEKPVSDDAFAIYQDLYKYDKSALNPTVESVDASSGLQRREKVTFDAAYGKERVIAHLFLPKGIPGPYQTVIYFPGSGVMQMPSSDDLDAHARILADVIVRSGRAFVYPVYKGMQERRVENFTLSSMSDLTRQRDWQIQCRKDLGRTIDYLETRAEIDTSKLAFHGFSLGGSPGVTLLGLEDRIAVAVIEAGGLPPRWRGLPEADLINFLPRVHIPVLMLSGRYDTTFPVEASQVPMFRLLGSPDRDKRHQILEGSHGLLFTARNEVIRETLDWLDRYLGPVQ
jgi:dienelactone hydrolase